jgi:adenylate kinase family enzyme
MRTAPNVIVTGTPGVGKTVHCEQLAQDLGLKHLSVNQVAKDRDCYEEYDEERKSWVVDDDKLLDAIEDEVLQGGYLIDWHACDMFPKSWIDLVVVLRCPQTSVLYDRLSSRYALQSCYIIAHLTRVFLGATTRRNCKKTSTPRSSESYSKKRANRTTRRSWWS